MYFWIIKPEKNYIWALTQGSLVELFNWMKPWGDTTGMSEGYGEQERRTALHTIHWNDSATFTSNTPGGRLRKGTFLFLGP